MTEDWIRRWREGRTGWHEPSGSAALRRHWRSAARRVLVPLCGKSPDLRWLAERGHEVVGIELVEQAIRAFFEEQGLSCSPVEGKLEGFCARELPITIWRGDFFEFEGPPCEAHYDRAALVALPPGLRRIYARHVDRLLVPRPDRLAVTLEREDSPDEGPPFGVPPEEVLGYWPDLRRVGERTVKDARGRRTVEAVWRAP
ncbi:MAG: thiopurine S-methyltransferase [Planctomycetota bacterium]